MSLKVRNHLVPGRRGVKIEASFTSTVGSTDKRENTFETI